MKKEDFLKLLQARLVERGVPEDTAKKETEHVHTYLSESGMEDLEIEVDEMADGIIAMLNDPSETEEETPAVIAVPADSESESVSDELSAAIAAMEADPVGEPDEIYESADPQEDFVETENMISAIPIVLEPEPEPEHEHEETHGDGSPSEKDDPAVEAVPEINERPATKEDAPFEELVQEEAFVEEDPSQDAAEVTEETSDKEEETSEEADPEPAPPAIIEQADPTEAVQETPAESKPVHQTEEEDADIEEFIPYDKKKRMKNNAKQQNNDNAWLYVTLLVITIPIVIVLILIAFALYLGFWVVLALAMIACIALLVVFVTVGAIVSLVGIVYGVVQLITGLVPVGLFEVGLGIIVGSATMFVGILVYNFAVRFIPFGMKLLAKLFRAGFRGIRSGYQSLKGAVASL